MNKKYWLIALVGVTFVSLAVYLELRIPGYMREITMLVQTPNTEISEIWTEGFWMLLTAFAALASTMVAAFCSGKIAAGFGRDLRVKIFGKVLNLGMAEINEFSVPSLITRGTNDVATIEQIVTIGFITLVRAPIMAVWATTRIFGEGLEWAYATMVAIAVMLFTLLMLVIFALPKFKILPKLTDKLNQIAREHLSGIRIVKAYNGKDYEAEKFNEANEEFMKTSRYAERLMAVMWPLVGLVFQALPLAIYLIGAYLINGTIGGANDAMASMDMVGVEYYLTESGELFASMMVFAQYAMQVVMAFLMMSMMFMFLPQALVAARRIGEVLNKEESMSFPETKREATSNSDVAIEFKDVSFKYPEADDYVLENINFTVNTGETAAIIGATGSGKTTLLKLIARIYDRTNGDVTIAGKDVKDYTEEELTTTVGYTLQKATLLSGSIASNIAFGRKNQAELQNEIAEATDLAQATEFISRLEDKHESPITQGATNVSGGQRQRLSIARTLFRNTDILMFDDSFSALDYKTDRALRKALKEGRKDATKIIVAQRVSTIKDADKIIVLDEGRIVGLGTHQELLQNCEVYLEIASSQLSKEELANG